MSKILSFQQVPQSVWFIILDYLCDKDIIGYDKTKKRVKSINYSEDIIDLTFLHDDMFEGWSEIIGNYWKYKRKLLKKLPQYQFSRMIDVSMTMLDKDCIYCGKTGFVLKKYDISHDPKYCIKNTNNK